jgi:hypothetical protein
LILGCLLGLLTTSACSGGGQPPAAVATTSAIRAPLPQVVDDCEHFAERPAEILVACGDGNYRLIQAAYERWSADGAEGRAVAEANNCTPNCADGRFVRSAVRFRLDGRQVVFGVPVFTQLTVLDPVSGNTLLVAPLLPIGCSVTPPSCPPSPPT